MAKAAMETLLGNLDRLQLHQPDLIIGIEDQVESRESSLLFLRGQPIPSTRTRRAVEEAEYIIDAFVSQTAVPKSQNYFLRAFNGPLNLDGITTGLDTISAPFKSLRARILRHRVRYNLSHRPVHEIPPLLPSIEEDQQRRPVLEIPPLLPSMEEDQQQGFKAPLDNDVVGFEDEAAKVIGYLMENTHKLDIISIIGLPGLGKTTLARKIFHDAKIQYEFPTRIWVYISKQFTISAVYQAILGAFTRINEDIYKKNDEGLARLVRDYLENGKFLIVMDDVWTVEDWEKIKVALPTSNNGSKVIITSRNVQVGLQANPQRNPHQLRFLTERGSSLLLQWGVFGTFYGPDNFKYKEKKILDKCNGLPLAIVVISGLVKEMERAMQNAWVVVPSCVNAFPTTHPIKLLRNIISLSYYKLPDHLKPCFLYLAVFPEDFEIPVWKLIRMWIAEGFIQQQGNVSMEEIAENYLDELIKWRLVIAETRQSNGRVKTCRIHDMMRDFCISEAQSINENFFQEVKWVPGYRIDPEEHYPRISIHSNVLNYLSLKPFGPKVRSFVSFSQEDVTLPAKDTSAIPAAFKLLRVLDVNPIKFTRIPTDMYQLVHLRYLALSFTLDVLPAAFVELWNLETLIAETTSRTLDIKADIWEMNQLRHVKTNASATLPEARKNAEQGKKLQTLGAISPQSCTDEVLYGAGNLKKLGVHGKLASLLQGNTASFHNFAKLLSLEKLKLVNDVFPSLPSEGQLRGLPPPNQFPPKLKRLTLSNTFLDWSQMDILGLLENLEVLKLKDKAFMGKSWEAKDGGFCHLEVLHIEHTDLTSWVASRHSYPRLGRLVLRDCEELQEIPISLADIPNFQLLDLNYSKHAVSSARKIQEKKNMLQPGAFWLAIFPIAE